MTKDKKLVGVMKNTKSIIILAMYGTGFVISGEITGWHFGWNNIGMNGFFNLFFVAAILYLALSRIQIELGTIVPNATGPHSYTEKAFPTSVWLIRLTQFAIFVEFLFACPYISNTFGQYLSLATNENISGETISIITVITIGLIRILVPKIENVLIVVITLIGITELSYYFTKVYPHFSFNNITNLYDNKRLSFMDYATELPTAMWMFLGIEGISLVFNSIAGEDNVSRKKVFSYSYYVSYSLIFVLALFVLLFTAGSVIWSADIYTKFTAINNLHPLPTIIKSIMGENHVYKFLLALGIFGLGASLISIFFASIEQLKLLCANYFKASNSNGRLKEIAFTVATMLLIIVSIFLQIQDNLIYISVFGAVIMYIIIAISLLRHRWKSKELSQFSKSVTTASVVVLVAIASVTIIGFCSSRPTCALIFIALFLLYFVSQLLLYDKAK